MPNQIDSLGHIIDSLSKQVHDTQIGANYFTSILSIQTGLFLAIIAIAALFAWNRLGDGIKRSHNTILAKNLTFQRGINEKIEMFNGELSSQLVEMNNTSNNNQELLYRSMFLMQEKNGAFMTAFYWIVRTVNSIIIHDMAKKTKGIETYTTRILATLRKAIEAEQKMDEEYFKEMTKLLNECVAFNNGEFKDLVQPIFNEMNVYYYKHLPPLIQPNAQSEPPSEHS